MSGATRPNTARFVLVPTWVYEHEVVAGNATRLAVYVALRHVAWRYDGREFASERELAQVVGDHSRMKAETVRQHLRVLREAGIIESRDGQVWIPTDDAEVGGVPPSVGGVPPNSGWLATQHLYTEKTEGDSLRSSRGEGVSTRKRSPVFDALVEALGIVYDEMTERERKACGIAVAQLVKVGATPDEIAVRARRYRQMFPNAAFTPNAIASRWSELNPDRQTTTKAPPLRKGNAYLAERMAEARAREGR